nr:MAG TPA: jmjN domain [Caudoviricetes sp.]
MKSYYLLLLSLVFRPSEEEFVFQDAFQHFLLFL